MQGGQPVALRPANRRPAQAGGRLLLAQIVALQFRQPADRSRPKVIVCGRHGGAFNKPLSGSTASRSLANRAADDYERDANESERNKATGCAAARSPKIWINRGAVPARQARQASIVMIRPSIGVLCMIKLNG